MCFVFSRYLVAFSMIWYLNQRVILLPPRFGELQFGGYLKSGECLFLRWVFEDQSYLKHKLAFLLVPQQSLNACSISCLCIFHGNERVHLILYLCCLRWFPHWKNSFCPFHNDTCYINGCPSRCCSDGCSSNMLTSMVSCLPPHRCTGCICTGKLNINEIILSRLIWF